MSNFIWSQSALKDLEGDNTCPFRWYKQWVAKEFNSKPTAPMEHGNYFEYLCIGGNAKGPATKSLPLTLKGEKTAVQKRIEAQAELFKKMFDPTAKEFLGYKIVGTQVKLSGETKGIPTEGTADIEAIRLSDGAPVIIDLKLTDDAYSDYTWGTLLSEVDCIQQVLYQTLYGQQHGIRPVMVMMIFESGVQSRCRIIELDIDDWRFPEMQERFLSADEAFKMYEQNGWVKIPEEKECEKCPLSCDKRIIKSNISIEKQKY